MAVALDALLTGGNAGDTQTASGTTSISSTGITVGGSATLLVVLIHWHQSMSNPSVTWDGVTMNLAVSAVNTVRSSVYTLVSPASGAKTLAASWTTSVDCYMGAVSFTGTDTTTGYNSANNNSATSGTSLAVTSTTDGATVATFLTNGSTPTLNFNKVWDESSLNPGGGGSYQLGGTSNSHTFTGAGGTTPALAGINVIAGAGAAGQPITKRLGGVQFTASRAPAQQGMRQF